MTLASLSPASAAADTMPHCVSPAVPTTNLPVEVVAFYRAEIAKEFETYFAGVTDYLGCLDVERDRMLDEARAATARYAEILKLAALPEVVQSND